MNAICRSSIYYAVKRFPVPEDKVAWTVPWPEYSPPSFCSSHLKNSSYADPDINNENFKPVWNSRDGEIDRRSYDHSQPFEYLIEDNRPLNPRGRTGMQGRGVLGRWGPNHAADAVVTRWKRTHENSLVRNAASNQPILQFLAILRKDCKKWAIPGGFVDPNEAAYSAMLRELFEEAIKVEKDKLPSPDFFKSGNQVYKGYVDDPRNTDNAWIETTATNLHDATGENTKNLTLDARDDAIGVKWVDIEKGMEIYPTHFEIISAVNEMHLHAFQ